MQCSTRNTLIDKQLKIKELNTIWLAIPAEKRIAILNEASILTGLPAIAIEKDWWVTLALKACFSLPYSSHIVFKGGTSLSKGWNLIERFSEDIDLAIDRKFFGFSDNVSKSQIKILRKKSCEFISVSFLKDLTDLLTDWGAIYQCRLNAQPINDSDKDPQVIEIHYQSVLDKSDYLPQRVLIEISSRSLMEPSENREIDAILNTIFQSQPFLNKPFPVSTVLPQKTFLEKIFLLHEEFSQDTAKIRVDRLSRHLYDLERIMDTGYGKSSIKNTELFTIIVAHRKKFNLLRGLDYANHIRGKINIIPPDAVIRNWEKDYRIMTENMIYGDALPFNLLIKRMLTLQNAINGLME